MFTVVVGRGPPRASREGAKTSCHHCMFTEVWLASVSGDLKFKSQSLLVVVLVYIKFQHICYDMNARAGTDGLLM